MLEKIGLSKGIVYRVSFSAALLLLVAAALYACIVELTIQIGTPQTAVVVSGQRQPRAFRSEYFNSSPLYVETGEFRASFLFWAIVISPVKVEYDVDGVRLAAWTFATNSWRYMEHDCTRGLPLDEKWRFRRWLQEVVRAVDHDPTCTKLVSRPPRFRTGEGVGVFILPGGVSAVVAERASMYVPVLILLGAAFLLALLAAVLGIQYSAEL